MAKEPRDQVAGQARLPGFRAPRPLGRSPLRAHLVAARADAGPAAVRQRLVCQPLVLEGVAARRAGQGGSGSQDGLGT